MRIIQPGQRLRRNVLLGFYTQAQIGQMAKDLGPATTVLQVDTTYEPTSREALRAKVKVLGADELGEVCLAGWSAGCHGVRDNLRTVLPEVAILLDGTHAATHQPGSAASNAGPLAPWAQLLEEGRRGERMVIASHIYNTYVELLKPPDGPYVSTVTVLRQLTGWPLAMPAGDAPNVRREGDLVVYSWRSSTCDAPAHAAQVNHAGPLLVRDWLASRWLGDAAPPVSAETLAGLAASAGDAAPDTEPHPETRRTTDAPAGQQSGEKERPDIPLSGRVEASPGDRYLSHGYRCGVAELKADAIALGRWHPAADVRSGRYVLKPGDLVLSTRTGGMHVERIVGVGPGKPTTVGGNEANQWIVDVYDLAGAAFDGVIDVAAELGARAVAVALEEHAAGIKETPGPRATARISEYHAGARRGGSHVAGMPGHESEGTSTLGAHASDEVAWCASGASWCAYQAAKGYSAQSA
jgi:hypothetical protein